MIEHQAWLARTVEQALDPEVAICDPHHHLWDYPQNRYLVEEFLTEVACGHRVQRTVYVECQREYRSDGPAALRPVGETEFVDRITAAAQKSLVGTKVAAGIVGFADLTLGAAVDEVLIAHIAASSRFRGVRYATAWDADARIHPAHTKPPRGLLSHPKFREGFARLRQFGLSFDAWLYFSQIHELRDLAREFPDVPIVLNHAGGPLCIGPYAGRRDEVFEIWSRNIADLAACENVFVKLGGLSMKMSGFDWHKRDAPPGSVDLAESLRPYCDTCIDCFGSGRCMFESNFPIDRVSCSYTVLWNAYKLLTRNGSPDERSCLFHGTAERVYRLGDYAPT